MSHVTKLAGIQIKDVAAIRAAVADLQAKGVQCELVEDAVPRMHGQREEVAVGKCDYVLKLPNGKYDVGFKKQADGSYQAVMDTFGNHVGGQIGASCPMPNTREGQAQHQMGQFMQNYAKHAAMNAARAKGHQVDGCTVDASGKVQLQIRVR